MAWRRHCDQKTYIKHLLWVHMINKLFIHIPMIFIELVKIVSFARQGSQKIQKKKKKISSFNKYHMKWLLMLDPYFSLCWWESFVVSVMKYFLFISRHFATTTTTTTTTTTDLIEFFPRNEAQRTTTVMFHSKIIRHFLICNEFFVSKRNLFDVYFTTLQLVLVPCGDGRTSPQTSP